MIMNAKHYSALKLIVIRTTLKTRVFRSSPRNKQSSFAILGVVNGIDIRIVLFFSTPVTNRSPSYSNMKQVALSQSVSNYLPINLNYL